MTTRDMVRLEEVQLCQLRMDCLRPEVWVCGDCGKIIDRDPEYSPRWIICVACGASNFIDPDLVRN